MRKFLSPHGSQNMIKRKSEICYKTIIRTIICMFTG